MASSLKSTIGLLDVTVAVEISDTNQHLAFIRDSGGAILLLQSELIDLRDLLNGLNLPVSVKS